MNEPDFAEGDFCLADMRVAVIGMGLMGGSLGLALRGRCRERLGIDRDPAVLRLAVQRGAADRLAADPAELLSEADVVVLAAPVCAILTLLEALPGLHPGRAVVLDVGSTKVEIEKAMNRLPRRFEPLGGHPICGKERSSLEEADGELYRGQVFAFTPMAQTTPRARAAARQLAEAVGAVPLWLDADTHDRWIAATSHVPYLMANALAWAAPVEAYPLVGPGFRSTTRLGAMPAELMLNILQTNRDNVLEQLGRVRTQMERVEKLLREGDLDALGEQLTGGAEQRAQLLHLNEGGRS